MTEMSRYAVADFVDDNSVDVVPCTWLKEDGCMWPPYRNARLENAKKKCEDPHEFWTKYSVRVLNSYGKSDFNV